MFSILKEIKERCAARRLSKAFKEQGVFVSDKASLFGIDGVSLGQGTQIYPGAIVACSYLKYEDAPEMKPVGRITMGKGCTVLGGAIVATYGGEIQIGDEVHINPGVIIYGHGGVTIGSGTAIAAGSVIIPANHNFADPSIPFMKQGLTQKGIVIGEDVWIGTRVVILDGVRIGKGCVVGAGAVVNQDIPDFGVAVGTPARVIKYRNEKISSRS